MKSILSFAVLLTILGACQSNQKSKPLDLTDSANHKVIVKEAIQVSEYTYLLVNENGTERWLATPPITANPGDTYYYAGGFEMTNFKSRELNRTFPGILFLESISTEPVQIDKKETMVSPGATVVKDEQLEIEITPAEGGITIAELYDNRESYAGKKVKIKGQITKFSPEIMEINWIHIQDGTESKGIYDLTITSDETVNVGEVVTFEGMITLNKDLGYGYFYAVLLEDATVKK